MKKKSKWKIVIFIAGFVLQCANIKKFEENLENKMRDAFTAMDLASWVLSIV